MIFNSYGIVPQNFDINERVSNFEAQGNPLSKWIAHCRDRKHSLPYTCSALALHWPISILPVWAMDFVIGAAWRKDP